MVVAEPAAKLPPQSPRSMAAEAAATAQHLRLVALLLLTQVVVVVARTVVQVRKAHQAAAVGAVMAEQTAHSTPNQAQLILEAEAEQQGQVL